MSQFLVKVFAILGLTRSNSVYFSVNSSVIFIWLILGLGALKTSQRSLKSGLCTLRVFKTFLLISSVILKPMSKKNLFLIQRVGKKNSPGRPRNYFFFCQKLKFRYFLKQPCSVACCSSFHILTFFFILLHRNFNVTQQIFILSIILKHTLKISYPQSTTSKSYVFYEVEQINNFFSSLFTNFRL